MTDLECVCAKLAHSALDKLNGRSAACAGWVGERNPAYCVKGTLHCKSLSTGKWLKRQQIKLPFSTTCRFSCCAVTELCADKCVLDNMLDSPPGCNFKFLLHRSGELSPTGEPGWQKGLKAWWDKPLNEGEESKNKATPWGTGCWESQSCRRLFRRALKLQAEKTIRWSFGGSSLWYCCLNLNWSSATPYRGHLALLCSLAIHKLLEAVFGVDVQGHSAQPSAVAGSHAPWPPSETCLVPSWRH